VGILATLIMLLTKQHTTQTDQNSSGVKTQGGKREQKGIPTGTPKGREGGPDTQLARNATHRRDTPKARNDAR